MYDPTEAPNWYSAEEAGAWASGANYVEAKAQERLAQRQDSVADQLRDLVAVATKLGMYDAADWIHTRLDRERN